MLIARAEAEAEINLRTDLEGSVGISFDETTQAQDIDTCLMCC